MIAMERHFSSEFFASNRKKLLTLFAGTAPIVVTANGLLQSTSDSTFPLRQDRDFWYLTGVDEPDTLLIIDKSKEYLILSEEHDRRVRFDGATTADDIRKISGVNEILDHKAGWQRLNSRLKRVKHVATLPAPSSHIPFYGFYSNHARASLIEKVKSVNNNIELLDLKKHLIQMRIVKKPLELEAFSRAIAVTEKTLKSIAGKAWPKQTTEQFMANEIGYRFRRNGASDLAFDSVVASGANTAAIHHSPDRTLLTTNGLLLF